MYETFFVCTRVLYNVSGIRNFVIRFLFVNFIILVFWFMSYALCLQWSESWIPVYLQFSWFVWSKFVLSIMHFLIYFPFHFCISSFQEHFDYDLLRSSNSECHKAVTQIKIYRQHRQTVQVNRFVTDCAIYLFSYFLLIYLFIPKICMRTQTQTIFTF